ncbi:hypothetical protein F2P81_013765 [Scophthalmus maximus]|uniref:NADPH oxidase activator 1-like n=1 Tax=Scophthalmus maximus TaxID=52904 RepID=A0A6A4SM61_SCOMX|nr:hypothetical protein F2P81_013765 [Scophthalmus maximus]
MKSRVTHAIAMRVRATLAGTVCGAAGTEAELVTDGTLSGLSFRSNRMLYTELLQLWDESVQAVDAKDWQGALKKLKQISEPNSRTLFNTASAHLALGQLDLAMKALDLTIVKDERLAVGFFQRAAVMMQVER